MTRASVGLICAGSVLWAVPLPVVFSLEGRMGDVMPTWLFLIAYAVNLVGMVLLMLGLRGVPDKPDNNGVVHHRGPVLLIWFGAVIIVVAVVVFFVLLGIVGVVGLFGLFLPVGFIVAPIVALGGFGVTFGLTAPPAIVGAVYLYQGITLLVSRRKQERKQRLMTHPIPMTTWDMPTWQ